jgi:hypothetical protein
MKEKKSVLVFCSKVKNGGFIPRLVQNSRKLSLSEKSTTAGSSLHKDGTHLRLD